MTTGFSDRNPKRIEASSHLQLRSKRVCKNRNFTSTLGMIQFERPALGVQTPKLTRSLLDVRVSLGRPSTRPNLPSQGDSHPSPVWSPRTVHASPLSLTLSQIPRPHCKLVPSYDTVSIVPSLSVEGDMRSVIDLTIDLTLLQVLGTFLPVFHLLRATRIPSPVIG